MIWAIVALPMACGPTDRAFIAPDVVLVASDSELMLGPTAFGQVATQTLTLSNHHLLANHFSVALSDAPDFSVEPSGSITLEPGTDLQLAVHFLPSSVGPELAELTAGELVIDLVGLVDPDGDDDGALHELAGGTDCDDSDDSIGPDVAEIWYDGVDQNCDGNDSDADLDGTDVTLDCNDGDDQIGPDIAEIWYDGVDQDCDGNDSDADLDGFAGDGTGADAVDCDDQNPEIYPTAVDVLSGIDEDCDGITDEDGVVPGDIMFSELFTENDYKTGASDEYFELWMKVDATLNGWVLTSQSGSGVLQQDSEATGSWMLLCSSGLAAIDPSCSISVSPWPVISRSADLLTLSAGSPEAGATVIDQVSWDSSWNLSTGGLQLDPAALTLGESGNDTLDAWCRLDFTPGSENSSCL